MLRVISSTFPRSVLASTAAAYAWPTRPAPTRMLTVVGLAQHDDRQLGIIRGRGATPSRTRSSIGAGPDAPH